MLFTAVVMVLVSFIYPVPQVIQITSKVMGELELVLPGITVVIVNFAHSPLVRFLFTLVLLVPAIAFFIKDKLSLRYAIVSLSTYVVIFLFNVITIMAVVLPLIKIGTDLTD